MLEETYLDSCRLLEDNKSGLSLGLGSPPSRHFPTPPLSTPLRPRLPPPPAPPPPPPARPPASGGAMAKRGRRPEGDSDEAEAEAEEEAEEEEGAGGRGRKQPRNPFIDDAAEEARPPPAPPGEDARARGGPLLGFPHLAGGSVRGATCVQARSHGSEEHAGPDTSNNRLWRVRQW